MTGIEIVAIFLGVAFVVTVFYVVWLVELLEREREKHEHLHVRIRQCHEQITELQAMLLEEWNKENPDGTRDNVCITWARLP